MLGKWAMGNGQWESSGFVFVDAPELGGGISESSYTIVRDCVGLFNNGHDLQSLFFEEELFAAELQLFELQFVLLKSGEPSSCPRQFKLTEAWSGSNFEGMMRESIYGSLADNLSLVAAHAGTAGKINVFAGVGITFPLVKAAE